MTSSIKNPTKPSESVAVHCERNMIVHLDLDEKLQDTAMPSPPDFSASYVLLLSPITALYWSSFTLRTRPLFSFKFGLLSLSTFKKIELRFGSI